MSTDWGVVFATLVGPILAVWASDWRLERRRERERREHVYFTLMTTRAQATSPEHVSALNRIELVFPARKHEEVADRWRLYHRHLHNEEMLQRDQNGWNERRVDLFADLMQAMAADLGVPFSMETVRHVTYFPRGTVNEQLQWAMLREAFLNVLMQIQANMQANRAPAAGGEGDPAQRPNHPNGPAA